MSEEPDSKINEFEDEEIKAILREALTMKLKEKRTIPRRNRLNVALADALGQFLDCYKILGYDVDGNPINMTVYHNKMEKSALDCQFMEEFSDFMVSRKT